MGKRSGKRKSNPAPSGGVEKPISKNYSHWIVAALPWLLAAVAFAIYGPSLKFDFVSDARLEIDEGFVTSLSNLHALFSPTVLGMNLMLSDRPGEMIYLMLNSALWGKEPFGYHLDSVLLHATNVALLFVVLRRLLAEETGVPAREISLNAQMALAVPVLIFAVHPIVTESVAEVSFSSTLLVALFSLLALLSAGAFRPGPGKRAFAVAAAGWLCVLGAVLCKESGIAAAALMIVYWLLYRRGERKGPWLIFLGGAVVVTVAVIAVILEFAVSRQLKLNYLGGSFAQVFVIQPQLWVYMMGKLVWPVGLSADYVLGDMSLPPAPLACAILLVVLALQAWLASRSPIGAMGVAMYWIGLSTVSNFVPLFAISADRFYYLPLAGAAMQLAALFLLAMRSTWVFEAAMVTGVVALFPLGFLTVNREPLFANDFILAGETLRTSPHSTLMQNSLALAYFRKGQLDEAMDHYRQALEIEPKNSCANISLGIIHLQKGEAGEALAFFQTALENDPGDDDAHCSMGMALCRLGRVDEGIGQLREAVTIDPTNLTARANLGMALAQQGKLDEAVRQFEAALTGASSSAQLHVRLGNVYARQGLAAQAIEQYRLALANDPHDFEAMINLGVALAHDGHYEQAAEQDRAALKLFPNSPDLHDNLGVALIQEGKVDAAIAEFEEALRLKPDFTAAKANLERARFDRAKDGTAPDSNKLEPVLPNRVKTD